MANYKVPRYVQVVDALPLNASGKVLKYELREQGQVRTGVSDASHRPVLTPVRWTSDGPGVVVVGPVDDAVRP